MPEPTTVVYKSIDGCAIKADVYQPGAEDKPCPVIVYLHGGALIYGSRRAIHPKQLEGYLEAGYALISLDYRLAPETKLPQIVEDVQDGFRWVRGEASERFAIDARRVAVVGHSAGGYLALMAGCCVSPRPRAIVAFYGYGDIVGDWYSKPDPFYCRQPRVSEEASGRRIHGPVISEPYEGRGKDQFYLYCRQRGLWPQEVVGHDPAAEPEFFVPYCPVQNVASDYPSTLLLHGDRDTDVPYAQSAQMAEALARADIEHELIRVPDGGHGFDSNMDDAEVQTLFRRVMDFLEQHQ